jgi:RNA polymerase sigma factor
LSRHEHLSYKEIAERLSISEKTVETQLSRALRFLRDRLSSDGFLCLITLFL